MIRLSLFQSIVDIGESINLASLEDQLAKINIIAKKFKPGSLGNLCTNSHDLIGSLSIKYNYLSILIFPSGKIKISGGLQRYHDISEESLEYDMLHKIILPVFKDLLIIKSVEHNIREMSYHFNVNIKRNQPIDNYFKFIDRIEKYFMIKKPKIFFQTKQRGRICAVKIMSKYGGTMLVDHSGNIQAFAYKDYNYFLEELNRLLVFI